MAGALESYNPWGKSDKAMIRRLETAGDSAIEYIAQAARGSDPAEPVWQCFRMIRTVTSSAEVERVTHATMLAAPGADGENLPGLTYL